MIAYDPAQPLIGLHLPKTAGTSFRQVLDAWFPGETLLAHYRTNESLPARRELRAGVCVYGHFNAFRGFGVSDYYPSASQFFCFLREPFARFVSLWRYLAPYGDASDALAFERWLILRGEEQLRGENLHSFLWYLPAPIGARATRTVLRQFVGIGFVERLQDSVDALASTLNRPTLAIPHINASHRPGGPFDRFRPQYERYFADEMEFYEAARSES